VLLDADLRGIKTIALPGRLPDARERMRHCALRAQLLIGRQVVRKRAGVAQCAGDDFRGKLRESAEVCPAYSCSDWRRLISGKTSSITELSAITLPKAASIRSSN
jgi:hypothetical protein